MKNFAAAEIGAPRAIPPNEMRGECPVPAREDDAPRTHRGRPRMSYTVRVVHCSKFQISVTMSA